MPAAAFLPGRSRLRRVTAALVVLAAVAALGAVPSAAGSPALDTVQLVLTPVATVDTPMAMATRAGTENLFVAERDGVVRLLEVSGETVMLNPTPVLDFHTRVDTAGERGFLGLAFDPTGTKLYVSYTNVNGNNRVDEYTMSPGGMGNTAVVSSRRQVVKVQHPGEANHNGGNIAFGPDGRLYLSTGDGGGSGDPNGNAQNRNSLLGKILRVTPNQSGSQPYTIPAGNPYVGTSFAHEIWLYGVRNPWRFSFDRDTGDLWVGDVGQSAWEEVDVLRANDSGRAAGRGVNLGWNRMEGTHSFNGGTPPPNHTNPKYEYPHQGGACSITGGFVYRGDAIPELDGAYVFGDFCTGNIEGLRVQGGAVTDHADLGIPTPDFTLFSFGEGANGELYVLQGNGPISRIDPAP